MKLTFTDLHCDQATPTESRDLLIKKIFNEAYDKDQYVWAAFRITRPDGDTSRQNLPWLGLLTARGELDILPMDRRRLENAVRGNYEHDAIPIRIRPIASAEHPSDPLYFLTTYEWHCLRFDLLSLENET